MPHKYREEDAPQPGIRRQRTTPGSRDRVKDQLSQRERAPCDCWCQPHSVPAQAHVVSQASLFRHVRRVTRGGADAQPSNARPAAPARRTAVQSRRRLQQRRSSPQETHPRRAQRHQATFRQRDDAPCAQAPWQRVGKPTARAQVGWIQASHAVGGAAWDPSRQNLPLRNCVRARCVAHKHHP